MTCRRAARNRRRVAMPTALCLIIATLAACAESANRGYVFGAGYREDVRTVKVPIWENTTFHHGLEMRLTEAIVKEIHRSTPWAVTTGAADTTLDGAITSVDLGELSTDDTSGFVQEQAVNLAVRFTWTDNRSGETLAARRQYRSTATFVPKTEFGEPIEVGEQAAVEALARDVVAELRSAW